MSQSFDERYAQLYDAYFSGWPGEIELYQELAAKPKARGEAVLEVACGTGRVALALAREGVRVTGLDLAAPMVERAQKKSSGMPNARWVQGDMRAFELEEQFGLAIIPAHSFQFMLTPHDQVACLECIRQHLRPGGVLVVNLDPPDVVWLADLYKAKAGILEKGKQFHDPETGHQICISYAWTYEPSTQTASLNWVWEEMSADSEVINRWSESMQQHCVFRFEMEHLLARAGFDIEAVYGDFSKHELRDDSSQMIWVAHKIGA